MKKVLLVLLYLCGIGPLAVNSRGAGAPSDPNGDNACITMTPQHGDNSPQSGEAPYTLTVNQTSYETGDIIIVTLSGDVDPKGLLIEARRIDQTLDTEEAIGQFTTPLPAGTKLIDCTDSTENAITHDSSSTNTLPLEIQWIAPASGTGHLVFRATVVEAFDTYYTGIESESIEDPASGPLVEMTLDPGTAITAEGCGTTKGCVRDPAGCNDITDCTTMVTFAETDDGNSIVFEMLVNQSPHYVAIGFSSDTTMGDEEVYACVFGRTSVYRGYTLPSKDIDSRDLVDGTVSGLTLDDQDGAVQCSFTRVKQNADAEFADLDESYYLLVALGVPSGTSVVYHGETKYITAEEITLTDPTTDAVLGEAPPSSLHRAHASLMIIGWILCASIAIMSARYFKQVWPNSKLLGEKVWFTFHRTLMLINMLCFIVAFIIIFVQVGGFVQIVDSTTTADQRKLAHAILGIIVVALGITNPVMAIFRCHPGTAKRPIFNWAHFFVGMTAFIAGIVCVFLGMDMTPLDLPQHTTWVMLTYVILTVIFVLIFEVLTCISKQKEEEKKDLPMTNLSTNAPQSQDHQIVNPPEGMLKANLLAFYAFCVLAFVIYFIVFIGIQ